jgi:hypothetical protein
MPDPLSALPVAPMPLAVSTATPCTTAPGVPNTSGVGECPAARP